MNEQPERPALKAKIRAFRVRLVEHRRKLDAVCAKRDAARRVWHEALAVYRAEMAAVHDRGVALQAGIEALCEERKHLPPKPLDVATIEPPATPGAQRQIEAG